MSRSRLSFITRPGLAALLWLALLLPLAQSAAAWHALSHAADETAQRDDPNALAHAAHCDLCLSAAALSGGALVPTLSALVLAATDQAAPLPARGTPAPTAAALAYRSRAPPSASR